MLVDYDLMSDDAKVWIYPSSRKFYPNEIEELELKIISFIKNWNDNEAFKTSYRILHNRFLIFVVDANSPINKDDLDKKIAFILNLQQNYNIELLDRMNVCFKQGDYIQYKDLKAFKKLLKNRAVSNKTIVFDNLLETKYELENHWEIPITDSWYSRFL